MDFNFRHAAGRFRASPSVDAITTAFLTAARRLIHRATVKSQDFRPPAGQPGLLAGQSSTVVEFQFDVLADKDRGRVQHLLLGLCVQFQLFRKMQG